MKSVYLDLRAKRGVMIKHHREQSAVVASVFRTHSVPFSFTFSDIQIYKDVHRVHEHMYTNSLLPFRSKHRGSQKERKHFCRHNVHRRSQTPSVPTKNRLYMVGHFLSGKNLEFCILYVEKDIRIRRWNIYKCVSHWKDCSLTREPFRWKRHQTLLSPFPPSS